MNKRILISGGAGFIGSNTVKALIEKNEITVIDNLSNSPGTTFINRFIGLDGFRFFKRDLADYESAFDGLDKFDLVIHLAAHSDVRGGFEHPETDFKDNIVATKNLLDFMRKSGSNQLIFSSTSAVYGEASILPTPESYGPCIPISTYGATKLACEGLIAAYSSYYGIKSSIFRFANVVGGNSTHGIIYDLIRKLKHNKKELELLGDGNQAKSYIHVSDCVNGMLFLHEKLEWTDIINLGNKGRTAVKRIADIVIDKCDLKDVRLKFSNGIDGRGWHGDVKQAESDITKAIGLGWKNKYGSDEAVSLAVGQSLAEKL